MVTLLKYLDGVIEKKKIKKDLLANLVTAAIPGKGKDSQNLNIGSSQRLQRMGVEDKFKYSIKIKTKENQNGNLCNKCERNCCL